MVHNSPLLNDSTMQCWISPALLGTARMITCHKSLEKEQLRTRWCWVSTPQSTPQYFFSLSIPSSFTGVASGGSEMLLSEWKASKTHPLCHATMQDTCALHRVNSLCSYFVPQPRGDGAQPWCSWQSSSQSSGALLAGLVEAGKQRAGLKGLLPSQLPISCSSFSTHSPGRKGCFWWHTSL